VPCGFPVFPQDRWGRLTVTLTLATFGLAFGLPLGIFVALAAVAATGDPFVWVFYVELISGR
jgi:general L-amino acid transport system permease protein